MISERRTVGRFEWERALRDTPGVSMALRGVLALMATYATTKTGEDIRPSLSAMAERLGAHRSTLTKHVTEGVRLGWLECAEDNSRHGKPSVYRLTRPMGGDALVPHPVTLSFRTTGTETGVTTGTYTDTEEDDRFAGWDLDPMAVAAIRKHEAASLREAETLAQAPSFD